MVVGRSGGGSGRELVTAAFQFVFFFQAEDGIRDKLVTGVQTCALPISWKPQTNFPVEARRATTASAQRSSPSRWPPKKSGLALPTGRKTRSWAPSTEITDRSEEHTSELQSLAYLVCRLLLEKKNLV